MNPAQPTPSQPTALLLIDLQQGLFRKSTSIYRADAHSSYSKDAAGLIDEWNRKLIQLGVHVMPTQALIFA